MLQENIQTIRREELINLSPQVMETMSIRKMYE